MLTNMRQLHLYKFRWTLAMCVCVHADTQTSVEPANTNTFNSVRNAFQIPVYTWSRRLKHYAGSALPSHSNTSQMCPKPAVLGIGVFLHMNASLSTPHTPRQSHQPNTKARCPPRCVNTVQPVKNHCNALLYWPVIVVRLETPWHRDNCYIPVTHARGCLSTADLTWVKLKPKQPGPGRLCAVSNSHLFVCVC